jgi:hypothetical protein
MPIKIDIEVFRSVSSMNDNKIRQIIDQTTKVIFNGEKPLEVKPVNETITVEVPTNLGDGRPLVIVLMNEKGETLAELGYDQEAGNFPQNKQDGDQDGPYEVIVKAIDKLAPVIEKGFIDIVAAIEEKKAAIERKNATIEKKNAAIEKKNADSTTT